MFSDFEAFKQDISWLVKPGDRIVIEPGELFLSETFTRTFPLLHRLVKQARVLYIGINDDRYRLLSWTTLQGKPCGWLCLCEPQQASQLVLIPEHQLLVDEVGGIRESYHQPSGALTNNQEFLFVRSFCERGLGDAQAYYLESCEAEGMVPMPDGDLISFVQEANGSLMLYHRVTRQVYYFSHDHCFDNVAFLFGQPEYTFHTINGINTFIDFVETLAQQWLNYVVNTELV